MRSDGTNGLWVWAILAAGLVALTLGVIVLRARLQPEPFPVLGQVDSFSLTNQLGQRISANDFQGHIWVADIIFTRCPGPCLLMSRNLSSLQARLAPGDAVKLLSLTADPQFDTVEVLRAYAERFEADGERWQFVTGPKATLYRLAIDDLKLTAAPTEPDQRENLNDLFIHSTTMVLVDGAGRVRAYLDGTDPEAASAILSAIRRLQRESNP